MEAEPPGDTRARCGVIAADQRIHRRPGVSEGYPPVKPVSYSVVKAGLISLIPGDVLGYKGVRVNAISPGGVYNDQPDEFVQKLTDLIPLRRTAAVGEYQGALIFCARMRPRI